MAIADLIMPKMGESIMEATILKWHKKVGDHVKLDETVLDIATDKVDSEIPSPVEGTITEILYPENNVVPVGNVIAKIETNADSVAPHIIEPVAEVIIPEPIVEAPLPVFVPEPEPVVIASPPPILEESIPFQPSQNIPKMIAGNNRFFSPLVLNIANSEGISLSELEKIPGTGADGRVSKKDIIQYIADKRAGKVSAFVPAPAAPQVVYVQQEAPVQAYQQPAVEIPTPVQQVVLQKAADAPVYIAPQPIVEQPVIYPQQIVEPVHNPSPVEEFHVPQPIVEPAYEPTPASAPAPQPSFSAPTESLPISETQYEPIVEAPAYEAYQPIVEPIVHAVTEPVYEAPVAEPVYTAPIVEEVFVPQPIIETPPIVEKIVVTPPVAEVPTPVVEAPYAAPTPAPPVEQAPKVPVYMVQPTAPTVPLVTLAEGGSGKYTSPTSAHPSGNVEIIEMDRMRKLIAKHMVDSVQTSPHVTSFAEADVTNMVLWRDRVKNDFERREGTKITFTPMFIDCLVKVLKRYPLLNASVDGDKIIIKKDLNIGMATALPTGNLIVPVIKGADQLNIVGLSTAVNKLANDARNNQLKPDDISGGTFTFTNVGTFGTLMGTPIINQPQVAILAVGTIKKRPVVIESPTNDTIGIRHMMYLSLSYDHRIIDGSMGSSFLSEVVKEFESWDLNRTWYHYL